LKFFDGTPVVAEFDYPAQLPNIILSEELRRTIFLVVKETLNNTAKYADSKTILIKLFLVRNRFQIIIEDHGKGFDISRVREFANGLANMKSRMARINGSYEIYPSIDKGTKTILNVPY
jgi:signal transduction histidine kinase